MDREFKIGDRVTIHYNRFIAIDTVASITNAGFIKLKKKNDKLFKPNGDMRGQDTWYKVFITHATQADIDRIRKSHIANKLNNYNWNTLPLSLLAQIEKVIAEYKPDPTALGEKSG